MASIVKRGRSYAVVYYEGVGKKRQQVWESGLSYTAAKSRKAKIELEQANSEQGTPDKKDMTVSEFLYEFIEKYGAKNGWLPLMMAIPVCWKITSILIWEIKNSEPSKQRR